VVLAYASRDRLARATVAPVPWALPVLTLLGVGALLSSGSQGLQVLFIPPLVLAAVTAAFGFQVARVLLVPVAFLYFAAPVWSLLLTPPMVALTSKATAVIAPLVGLPATVAGTRITFPNGISFYVSDACSGANFLIQGLAIATLLGELERAPLARRVLLWASMVPVALIANWLRVLLILLMGYGTNLRSGLATRDHVAFGFGIFLVVLAVYVWAATRKALPLVSAAPSGAQEAWRPQRPYFLALGVMVSVAVAFQFVGPVAVNMPGGSVLHLPGTGW